MCSSRYSIRYEATALLILALSSFPAVSQAQEPLIRLDHEPRAFLQMLIGTWRVEPFTGAPREVAFYVFRSGDNDLTLEWEERLPAGPQRGHGVFGYDPAERRFYMTGVYHHTPDSVMFLTGIPEDTATAIRFDPVPERVGNRDLIQSHFRVLDSRNVVWSAFDRR
jgi:hypothetical protein